MKKSKRTKNPRNTRKKQLRNLSKVLLMAMFGETPQSIKKIIKNKAPTW